MNRWCHTIVTIAASREFKGSLWFRYGFKFWSQDVSNGYLVKKTEPYQGKGTVLGDSHLGAGASVVGTFADKLKESLPDRKFNFFIDNFFTGLPLIQKLSNMDFGCTGTVRQNQCMDFIQNFRRCEEKGQPSAEEFVRNSKTLDLLGFIIYIVPDAVSRNLSVLHFPNSVKQNRCKVCKKYYIRLRHM